MGYISDGGICWQIKTKKLMAGLATEPWRLALASR
jgi:hypothetical protein